MKRLNTVMFIDKARQKHGDLYDYTLVDYTLSKNPVIIVCRHHGEFRQKANNHISGAGCPGCAGNKQLTNSDFIRFASLKHFGRYDYSLVRYVNAHRLVTIVCKIHGEFHQTPDKHLSGRGCPDCGGSKQSNTQEFIRKAKCQHGEKYDYSLSHYVKAHKPLKILCRVHGEFMQAPSQPREWQRVS